MEQIRAIETHYKGYRFRSRLEARWAVFFDAARIEYEYEPEGFELYDGTKYLPDFYLPEFDLYVEIKPFDRTIVKCVGDGNKWEEKCRNFRDSTDKAILLCYGSPSDNIFKLLFAFDTCDSGGGSSEFWAMFVEFQGKLVVCTEPTRTDRVIYTRGFSGLTENGRVGTPAMFTGDLNILWDHACNLYNSNGDDLFNTAATKARQARFEHGETPIINRRN